MMNTVISFTEQDFEAVELGALLHPRIKIHPIYFEQGFSPSAKIFARRAVQDRLIQALQYLPETQGFLIWDVYRPRAVQKVLFEWMREEVRKRLPQLTESDIETETRKYASAPSKIGDAHCPPHLSGGAVDLTIFDFDADSSLEMGAPFDDCSERAHAHYFEQQQQLTITDEKIRKNREQLRHAMMNVGFTVYQYEWWHFDIGNVWWSRQTEKPAVFGPLFGDKEWPSI
jgi:D-alanyl-D-alanine dipeptidase